MNPEDPTQPLGTPEDSAANEPTQAIPTSGGTEPTTPLPPTSMWARPQGWADTAQYPAAPLGGASPAAPAGAPRPAAGSFAPPTGQASQYGTGQGYTQPGYPQNSYGQAPQGQFPPYGSYSQGYNPQYGSSPYGLNYGQQASGPAPEQGQGGQQARPGQQPYAQTPQQSYAPQGYGQQPYNQQAYNQQQGYPPHPGYYAPNEYYSPTQAPTKTTTKKRWPLAVVAILVALVLGGSSFVWAANELGGAASSPTITTEPQDQSGQSGQVDPSGQEDPTGQDPWQQGGQTQQGGTATGNGVSTAQSAGVVLIQAQTSSGMAAGTGMILSADGKVLTNYHVVAGSEKLAATVADSGDTYSATVLGFDQTRDVALIQLKDASGLTTVRTDTQVPAVGSEVAAVGNAQGGGELVKAAGQVTGTNKSLTVSSDSPWGNTEDLSGLIETNAGAVPGDSGGPMFDSDNEVIGMTTAGSTQENTAYAVPIATALAVVQQVESGQDAGTVRVGPAGYLGIKVADSDQTGNGKTITAVVSGSPAAKAGVTAGSRLTKVGDTTIKASTNLATVIRALEPGQQVSIEWTAPNGTHKSATVTLGSSPVN